MASKTLPKSSLDRLSEAIKAAALDSSAAEVEASVAVLLIENDAREVELLLVQRVERNGDPWSGHIGLPGGRIKATDDSPLEACKREVMEEVGVDLRDSRFLGGLSPNYPSNRPELKVQPFVFRLEHRPRVSVGPEIVNGFWIPLSRLPTFERRSEVETRLGKRFVESFFVNDKVVWGFTFRVLEELLTLYAKSTDGLSKS